MDHDALQALVNSINKLDSGDANHSKLAPQPNFTGCSLREVYEHFIAHRERDETVQPLYFIVVDAADFQTEGVLGIYLGCCEADEGGDPRSDIDGDIEVGVGVGVARCPVDRADGWGADFYYGLATWAEMRGEEEVEYESKEEEEEDKEYDTRPGPIRLRGMYGLYSLVPKGKSQRLSLYAILRTRSASCVTDVSLAKILTNHVLDPLWLDQNQDECRVQMLGDVHASHDPWAEIHSQHAHHAALRLRIHRQVVLVIETEEVADPHGVAVVRLEPDRTPKVLARVSADKAIKEADAIVRRLELWNPWEPVSYRELM